jgi:hypothetical protein
MQLLLQIVLDVPNSSGEDTSNNTRMCKCSCYGYFGYYDCYWLLWLLLLLLLTISVVGYFSLTSTALWQWWYCRPHLRGSSPRHVIPGCRKLNMREFGWNPVIYNSYEILSKSYQLFYSWNMSIYRGMGRRCFPTVSFFKHTMQGTPYKRW